MDFGGIETMLINIINEQIKEQEIVLYMINARYEQTLLDKLDKRVKIISIGRPVGSKNPFYIFKLNYLLYKEKADIIHIHHPGIIRFIAKQLFLKKTAFTMHDIPTKKDLNYIYYYPHIFSISKSVKDSLSALKLNSVIVTNGIITSNFRQRIDNRTSNTFKIVQIGRLYHEKKGQDILIKACANLVAKGINKIHIDFIGDGKSLSILQDLVQSLHLEEYITFSGSKTYEYIAEHLKDYDLFVQPSRREGFGLTVAEAMAARVPVLVSNQEGPLEIIENGRYGFSFISENINDCSAMIEYIIKNKNLSNLTNKAYEHVAKNYDVKRTACSYLQEYKNILK